MAARLTTPAPWTRPNAPLTTRRPSWIGRPAKMPTMPPVRPPSGTMQAVRASARPGSMRPSALPPRPPSNNGMAAVRPSMMPPRSVPSTLIQSAREVELESEVVQLGNELARLNDELEHVRTRVIEEAEPEIVKLALAIAERVVGRELTTDPSLVVAWIRESFSALPGRAPATVAVAADVPPMPGLDIVVDPMLAPGCVEIREGASTVEISADARFAAMADALGIDT